MMAVSSVGVAGVAEVDAAEWRWPKPPMTERMLSATPRMKQMK